MTVGFCIPQKGKVKASCVYLAAEHVGGFSVRVPFGVRVPYYSGDLTSDSNLENYPM